MLNYNHLRYFWTVGREGRLTRAAEKLNLSQSALSAQIRTLEQRLGLDLFERRGRRLVLTPAGQLAMDHCETIFSTGEAMLRRLSDDQVGRTTLRVGALSTLSRNFQIELLRPLLASAKTSVVVRSGTMAELLSSLKAHRLDLVLVNQVPLRDSATAWTARVLDKQPVSLIGSPHRLKGRSDYRRLLSSEPLILPTADSGYRNGIDLIAEQLDTPMQVIAEIDDMAMLRLLAREDIGLAVLPPVVVRDELESGRLVEACRLPDVSEVFSAITLKSGFLPPAVRQLLEQTDAESGHKFDNNEQ
ncbi:MAG: LysR family transcriptional regulator [Alphaproteobacteria bacterium]|jgi:LysR family transcriptional activator of nhaA|nr:LysR family transcriptional regulator [Alphaproteobacteria bacterium]